MSISEFFSGAQPLRRASRVRRAMQRFLPVRRFGAVRTIVLTRCQVLKLPGRWTWGGRHWWWDYLLRGLLSNMQETKFAAERWPELCPVSFSNPGGFLLVMPRARPLTDAEWQQLNYRAFVTRGEWYVEENFDALAGAGTRAISASRSIRSCSGMPSPTRGWYLRNTSGTASAC
ncbi:hypothetical protein ACNJX9_17090 [Bradyrhizobium sp. DASA03076]|uniref:hypothetical protein n=1 Tax=Bradyrhizobium sp. BLXBL-03 TaxID=3395916 RepID=UPI003F6E584F